jgi:hypothetical protein
MVIKLPRVARWFYNPPFRGLSDSPINPDGDGEYFRFCLVVLGWHGCKETASHTPMYYDCASGRAALQALIFRSIKS